MLFFTPSIISFIIVGIVWVGGNKLGTIFVKQRDEYMYRCDIFIAPSPPVPLFYLLPSMPQLCPIFVRKACTHSSLLRFCPDVFFFFSVKLKHVILLLNYYPFLCLKVSCWKPSNQIKKKSEMLRSLLVHVKSLYLKEKKQNYYIIAFQLWLNNVVRYNDFIIYIWMFSWSTR